MTAGTKRTAFLTTGIALIAAGMWWVWIARDGPPASRQPQPLADFVAPAELQDPATQLRPALAEALGYGIQDIPWDRRYDLIRSLPDHLAGDEINSLLRALVQQRKPEVSAAVYSSYVHEIACKLQHHPEAREPFAKALAMIARDNRRDPTTRDYAIQHLRQLCDASSNDTSLRDAMVATFEQLADQDAVVAAPALLSLHLIGREDSRGSSASGPKSGSHAYPDASIQQHLSPVFAQTTHAGNIALRMTAARIAGERRLDSCRQALLDQVFDSSEHTMVRMAAANAIGRIGNPDDLQKLGSFPPGDERVTTAVRHALRNRTPL